MSHTCWIADKGHVLTVQMTNRADMSTSDRAPIQEVDQVNGPSPRAKAMKRNKKIAKRATVPIPFMHMEVRSNEICDI